MAGVAAKVNKRITGNGQSTTCRKLNKCIPDSKNKTCAPSPAPAVVCAHHAGHDCGQVAAARSHIQHTCTWAQFGAPWRRSVHLGPEHCVYVSGPMRAVVVVGSVCAANNMARHPAEPIRMYKRLAVYALAKRCASSGVRHTHTHTC